MQFDYPPIEADGVDLLLVTHEHVDHNGVEAIGGEPAILRSTAGRLESPLGEVVGVASEHDDAAGTERGPNTIFVFELDGLRVAHFGDFGQAELRPSRRRRSASRPALHPGRRRPDDRRRGRGGDRPRARPVLGRADALPHAADRLPRDRGGVRGGDGGALGGDELRHRCARAGAAGGDPGRVPRGPRGRALAPAAARALVRGVLERRRRAARARGGSRSGAPAPARSGGRRARRSSAAAGRAGRCRSGCRGGRPRSRRGRCCRGPLTTRPSGSAPGRGRCGRRGSRSRRAGAGPSPRSASIATLPISRGPGSRTVSRSARPSPGSFSSPSW